MVGPGDVDRGGVTARADRFVEVRAADAAAADVASGIAWASGAVAIEEVAAADGSVLLRIGSSSGGFGALVDALHSAGVDVRIVTPARSVDDYLADELAAEGARRVGVHLVLIPIDAARPLTLPRGGPTDVLVRIDPGRAFGSGSHPTTRLCLELVEEHVLGGEAVLDVGTGTGVLAVAAARLGARRVVAIDIDPEAVRATEINAESNGVAALVEASDTPLAELDGSFDVVVANVLAGALVELAPGLVARVRVDGVLVLSGIIESREAIVVDTFGTLGWRVTDRRESDDWLALVLGRDGYPPP